jgi:GT2 family glycosyltransferase
MQLSICTLTWDGLPLTKKFVESVKKNTVGDYELIMVDNGSGDGTQEYIRQFADKYHFFSQNVGFAKGFNKALSLASGDYLLVINNDTEVPADWFSKLKQALDKDPQAGLVYPCYTSGNKIALRYWPGWRVRLVKKFNKELPAGVAIFSKTAIFRDKLGGFSEDFEVAGGEDLDLCFKAWAAGYNIYIDDRVLVRHKGGGTSKKKLPNWSDLYTRNGDKFQAKWRDVIGRKAKP